LHPVLNGAVQPTWSWSDYTVLDARPKEPTDFVLLDTQDTLVYISWFAGPGRVVGCSDLLPRPDLREEATNFDGRTTRSKRSWGPDDEEFMVGLVNEALTDIGAPPRPSGLDWYLWAPGVPAAAFFFGVVDSQFPASARSRDEDADRVRWLVDSVIDKMQPMQIPEAP